MSTHEDTLLAAAKSGEEHALTELLLSEFENLANHVGGKIPLPLQSTISVEDILQSAFICVFRDISGFEGTQVCEFRGWLRSIAEARRVDTIKAVMRKKRGGHHNRVDTTPPSPRRTPSQSAAKHEAVDALLEAIAELPDDQRRVIWLRHIEHLSVPEIAAQTGRTEDAVRGLIHRSKTALRKIMGNSSAWFSRIG